MSVAALGWPAPGRLAAWRAGAASRPRRVALVLGALAALALPPLHWWPMLLAFAGLLYLVMQCERPRQAFLLGWLFGFGHFIVGLYWIAIAFFTDVERFGALALPAILLLCAWLAVFPGLAAWLIRWRRWRSPASAALALATAWTLAEILRASFPWGGFPWNLIGYSWTASLAISQAAALVGIFGLSWLTVALAALPASLLPGWPQPRTALARHAPLAAIAVALALLWGGGAWRLAGGEVAAQPELRLRLVQGNISQFGKWQDDRSALWFRRHLDLSHADAAGITTVIWPESASPYRVEDDLEARRAIADVTPPGGYLLTGGTRIAFQGETPQVWNSLFAVDPAATVRAHYDKHILVPFGEFLPLRAILGRIGLEKMTQGTLDFQTGPGPATLELPGLPAFSPLICYEAIFPGRVVAATRPQWLLNITNDAWFGWSAGPYQHLAMARLRAVEQGLPLVRSANTGISAVFDPFGRELARLELNELGVLDSALPQPLPAPFYARQGWLPVGLLLAAGLLFIALIEKHSPKHT